MPSYKRRSWFDGNADKANAEKSLLYKNLSWLTCVTLQNKTNNKSFNFLRNWMKTFESSSTWWFLLFLVCNNFSFFCCFFFVLLFLDTMELLKYGLGHAMTGHFYTNTQLTPTFRLSSFILSLRNFQFNPHKHLTLRYNLFSRKVKFCCWYFTLVLRRVRSLGFSLRCLSTGIV